MKKIAILSHSQLDGDGRVLRQINALKNKGFIDVYAPSREHVEIDGVDIHTWKGTNMSMMQSGIMGVLTIIAANKMAYKFSNYTQDFIKATKTVDWNIYDVFIVNDAHLLPQIVMINKKLKSRKTLIFDAHEYTLGDVNEKKISAFARKKYKKWICDFSISSVDFFITVSDDILNLYKKQYKCIKQSNVIMNTPNYQDIISNPKDSDKINLIHHGVTNAHRELENMIEVMRILPDNFVLSLMLVVNNNAYYSNLKDIVVKNNLKIIAIVGARPQFIKAAPLSSIIRKENKEILVHTGQHYDENMSKVFFEELSIPKPDYNLGIGSGNHGKQTGRMLEKIEEIVLEENPDGLLVYGDTNSTLAGALAASKLHVPLFHVEAGLRSFNKKMPEEQNRVLTDHISDLLLCPTQTAVDNLTKENIVSGVVYTGDIMYDAVLRNNDLSKKMYNGEVWINELNIDNDIDLRLNKKEYFLTTIHRAENTDNADNLKLIFEALESLDKPVLLPIHPRTLKLLRSLGIKTNNIIIIKPVGYLMMLYLISNAYMVVTDSGGLQKEAYFLQTPCTTLRDQTEWIETLENEWNVLCSIGIDAISKAVNRRLDCLALLQGKLFGNGQAAEEMYKSILGYFKDE